MKKTSTTVDAYIKTYPKEIQARLQAMRKIVRKAAPEAVESMSYGLAGYKLHGKPLVYFGGFKNHVGFYATPSGHVAFEKELSKYQGAKGSVKFPNDEPLPIKLVEKVVKYRIKENAERKKR